MLIELVRVGATEVRGIGTAGIEWAPAAVRPGSSRGSPAFASEFGFELALIEVVAHQEPRWSADAKRVEQCVEPKVQTMFGSAGTSFQVNDDLSCLMAMGGSQSDIWLAAADDGAATEFGA